jgi:hypothetical protein
MNVATRGTKYFLKLFVLLCFFVANCYLKFLSRAAHSRVVLKINNHELPEITAARFVNRFDVIGELSVSGPAHRIKVFDFEAASD